MHRQLRLARWSTASGNSSVFQLQGKAIVRDQSNAYPRELINSIPIGEENAITALEIWKRVSLWSHVTAKEK